MSNGTRKVIYGSNPPSSGNDSLEVRAWSDGRSPVSVGGCYYTLGQATDLASEILAAVLSLLPDEVELTVTAKRKS